MDTANLQQAQPVVTRRRFLAFVGVGAVCGLLGQHCPGHTAFLFSPHLV